MRITGGDLLDGSASGTVVGVIVMFMVVMGMVISMRGRRPHGQGHRVHVRRDVRPSTPDLLWKVFKTIDAMSNRTRSSPPARIRSAKKANRCHASEWPLVNEAKALSMMASFE